MMETNARKSDVVVAVDIGTTKVCAIAGRKNQHGKLEILGVGKVNSEGVLRGVVSNIEKTVNAISEAVIAARRGVNADFDWAHVGIAGQHIKSLQHRGILMRDNNIVEISQIDIDRLIGDMYKLVLPPGDKIIHVIPQEYAVDNEQGIVDPIGMSGVRLEANFHIITGQITASNNLYRCVERAGLRVANMTLEPIASAMSVLNEEEKEAGVALVDIGGGTTDITIFQDGIIRHTAVIPFGGNVITKDIKEGCTVMTQQAEKLKVKFGSALAEEVFDNRIITIPGLRGREHKEISEKNLARIIQARVEEILDYVVWEIRRSGFERKLIAGIVLTGGGALLSHIEKLSEYHTGLPTRIGIPIEPLAHGYAEHLSSPIYATAIGLLMKGIEDREKGRFNLPVELPEEVAVPKENLSTPKVVSLDDEEDSRTAPGGRWIDSLFKKTKEWFEAEPDADL
ncbi:MAG TPA: cell division protein FtsA [Haliscomenobacter sp.]|uniref:cell division protein FtsA n=1 Tax=Haliscomenobacter sp. TaxID=2717303 RepID=UPI001D2439D2|nr:cell division protein FtsA [Haliscomenobacter sp.]MBK9490372.1 cell division protein FtsA [Haliscomenobacter sp.]HOY16884.1 cell division protein FtsA [Haliscomenobacter sp.]HPH17488.1 cell division protein FtsA [Haliscomenobacter sp.]